jgi:membrane protease YdiL (CAAX protease family)
MNTATASTRSMEQPTTSNTRQIVVGFVFIYLIYFGSAFLFLKFDQTTAALIRTLLALTAVFSVEKFVLKGSTREHTGVFYFGWPGSRAFAVAMLAGIPFVAFFPIFTTLTGTTFSLPSNWLWIYLGYITVSGITEEVMFRAYLFGHLRTRYGFWRAAILSLIFFSAVHLLLLFRVNLVITIASILLASVSSFPLAYLYENSRGSIWAVALLHSLVHAISVMAVSDDSLTASLAFMAVTAVSPWIVFLFGRRYFSQDY